MTFQYREHFLLVETKAKSVGALSRFLINANYMNRKTQTIFRIGEFDVLCRLDDILFKFWTFAVGLKYLESGF